MRTAPSIPDESARLLDLARYNILDTSPEEVYDRITRIAAHLLKVPVAFIDFVDHDRHWGKAMTGIPGYKVPRADSLCAWTISQNDPLIVPDLRLDPHLQELLAVQDGLQINTRYDTGWRAKPPPSTAKMH